MGLAWPPASVTAFDWVTVNPLDLELLVGYRYHQYEQAFGSDSRDTEWEIGLRIEQEGYVEHPSVLSFLYALEPKYYLGDFVSDGPTGLISEDTSRNFLAYLVGIDIFRDSTLPVWGRFDAASNSTVTTSSLGRRSRSDQTYYGALLEWKFEPFPMRLEARHRTVDTITTRAGGESSFRRDDVENRLNYLGESSKTRIQLEFRSLDDRVPERNNDFDIYQANLIHKFNWGRDSRLRSSIDYYKREGYNAFERFQLREFASVRHTGSLYSEVNYGYGLTRQLVDTTRNIGTYKLVHQLYRNLRTGASIGLEKNRSGGSELDRKLAGLEVSYQKSNLFGASFSMYLSANFSNNDTDARGALLEVVDAPYTVPVTGLIILENRFILPASIIVTDTTSTVVYSEGQDYLVEQVADGLTQLSIIPGGLIEAGEVILVSYKAAAVPPREFDRLATSATLNLVFRGFSLTHSDAKLDYKIIDGDPGSLADTRNTTTRLAYSLGWQRASIQLAVERRYFRNGEFESTTNLATQSVGLTLSPKTRININFNQAFTDTNAEKVDVYSAQMDLTWRPRYNLTVRPVLGAWKRSSERLPNGVETTIIETDDTSWSASLTISWTFRKLSFDLTYSHNDRTLEQVPQPVRDSTYDTVRVFLRRSF